MRVINYSNQGITDHDLELIMILINDQTIELNLSFNRLTWTSYAKLMEYIILNDFDKIEIIDLSHNYLSRNFNNVFSSTSSIFVKFACNGLNDDAILGIIGSNHNKNLNIWGNKLQTQDTKNKVMEIILSRPLFESIDVGYMNFSPKEERKINKHVIILDTVLV